MSRKPSSLNSPNQDSDRTQKRHCQPEFDIREFIDDSSKSEVSNIDSFLNKVSTPNSELRTPNSFCQTPVVSENSSWPQFWGKLILNGYQSSEESNTESEPSPLPKKQPYLKQLLKFLSKLSRGNKRYFDPKQLQKEILEQIGEKLYDERQKQGLSLEVIEAETCISVGLLAAIEKGKLEELPEAIYTRSFIKKFADFLGLDGKSLSESFPLDSDSKSNRYARFRFLFPILQFRAVHLYFLYIIIVIFSVQSISNTLKRAALEGAIKQPQIPVTVSSPQSQSINKPVIVKVESTGKSTLKVTVDEKMIFDGVVTKDTQKIWEANENITIEASNAGLLLVTFNNQKAQRLGKLGESTKVSYYLTNISNE